MNNHFHTVSTLLAHTKGPMDLDKVVELATEAIKDDREGYWKKGTFSPAGDDDQWVCVARDFDDEELEQFMQDVMFLLKCFWSGMTIEARHHVENVVTSEAVENEIKDMFWEEDDG